MSSKPLGPVRRLTVCLHAIRSCPFLVWSFGWSWEANSGIPSSSVLTKFPQLPSDWMTRFTTNKPKKILRHFVTACVYFVKQKTNKKIAYEEFSSVKRVNDSCQLCCNIPSSFLTRRDMTIKGKNVMLTHGLQRQERNTDWSRWGSGGWRSYLELREKSLEKSEEHCELKSWVTSIVSDIFMVANEMGLDGQRMWHTWERWNMLRKVGRWP